MVGKSTSSERRSNGNRPEYFAPAKLDNLDGKRTATPILRKACFWLEIARKDGDEPEGILEAAHQQNGGGKNHRVDVVIESLLRNRTILERLGCLDADGMANLRRGRAPTITKGPYKGELATVDQIIPRSVCPELDNKLYNLEFMPASINGKKGAKVGLRQRQLGRQ